MGKTLVIMTQVSIAIIQVCVCVSGECASHVRVCVSVCVCACVRACMRACVYVCLTVSITLLIEGQICSM